MPHCLPTLNCTHRASKPPPNSSVFTFFIEDSWLLGIYRFASRFAHRFGCKLLQQEPAKRQHIWCKQYSASGNVISQASHIPSQIKKLAHTQHRHTFSNNQTGPTCFVNAGQNSNQDATNACTNNVCQCRKLRLWHFTLQYLWGSSRKQPTSILPTSPMDWTHINMKFDLTLSA